MKQILTAFGIVTAMALPATAEEFFVLTPDLVQPSETGTVLTQPESLGGTLAPPENAGAPLAQSQQIGGMLAQATPSGGELEPAEPLGGTLNRGIDIGIERPIPPTPQPLQEVVEELQPMRFPDAFFDTGSAAVKPAGYAVLLVLAAELNKRPDVIIEIQGHTDSVGTRADNYTLGNNRALAVSRILLDYGVSGERMVTKSFGEDRPEADNSTPQGRQINRRVDIIPRS
ncbi:OmpA family protein [Lentibacter algarum]|uniref:OmpA family protein n=1 Tax=Lentibacter algarum TaxID=576131 RepID=UPI001C06663E|nr:OmpA family protein [Lentibacter algarum]MBU2981168.1 OmpA family protein [Lentibacter algarum]